MQFSNQFRGANTTRIDGFSQQSRCDNSHQRTSNAKKVDKMCYRTIETYAELC